MLYAILIGAALLLGVLLSRPPAERKKLSLDLRRSPLDYLDVRIPGDLLQDVTAYCEQHKISLRQFAREAIEEKLR